MHYTYTTVQRDALDTLPICNDKASERASGVLSCTAYSFSSVSYCLLSANYKNQNLILVVPPSNIVASLLDFDPGKWLEDTINEIKSRCPEKEILVRYKYKDNIKPFRYDEPIDSFFPKTYCVVTHSSNLAFKTMMKGIPVISSYVSASRPVSNSFETINNIIEHDREHLLYSLLHGQFKLEEIQKKLVSFKEFDNMEQVIK